jgi:AraC-like DNA-binding protein
MRNTLSGLLGPRPPCVSSSPILSTAHATDYTEVLGEDLHFDCRQPLELSNGAPRDAPCQSSNPALRRLYEAECARLLADLQDTRDLGAQTRRLLRKFEGQYPQMPQLAAMLNVSPRTYRRRLAEQGTQLPGTPRQRACGARDCGTCARDRLPIASIAYQLGFSDPSNFRRAYRRWTGTPGEVRRRRAAPLSDSDLMGTPAETREGQKPDRERRLMASMTDRPLSIYLGDRAARHIREPTAGAAVISHCYSAPPAAPSG